MHKSALHKLSHAEQEQIQVMCSTETYDKVVAHIATPRLQGGLGLKTSKAALCRFVANYNSAPEQAAALGQLAKAVLLRSHESGQDALAAVITILQQDILYRLSLHCSMDSVLPMLRLLHRLQLDLFKLDKRQALRTPAMEKELAEMAAASAQLGELDCEVLDEPPQKEYRPPTNPAPPKDPRPYVNASEGALWPDQAERISWEEYHASLENNQPAPSNSESTLPEPAAIEDLPTTPESSENTISPIIPIVPITPIPPSEPTTPAPSEAPEYSTSDSTCSTKTPGNSTYSTCFENVIPLERPILLSPDFHSKFSTQHTELASPGMF